MVALECSGHPHASSEWIPSRSGCARAQGEAQGAANGGRELLTPMPTVGSPLNCRRRISRSKEGGACSWVIERLLDMPACTYDRRVGQLGGGMHRACKRCMRQADTQWCNRCLDKSEPNGGEGWWQCRIRACRSGSERLSHSSLKCTRFAARRGSEAMILGRTLSSRPMHARSRQGLPEACFFTCHQPTAGTAQCGTVTVIVLYTLCFFYSYREPI